MKGCYIDVRDNGTYRVRVIVKVDGEEIRTSTTYYPEVGLTAQQNRRTAELLGEALVKNVEADYWAAKAGKEVTFGKFFEETYLAEVEDHFKGTTGDFYVRTIRKHFLDVLENIKIKDVDTKMAQDMIEELNKKDNENDRSANPKKIASQTVKRYMTAFRSVINLAIEKRVIDVDPFAAGLHYKKFKPKNLDCFDENDFDTIVGNLYDKMNSDEAELDKVDVIIAIGMFAGLRRGEIVALRWKNFINLRAETLDSVKIDICHSAHKRKGLPQEDGDTKTVTSTRMFTIPLVLGEVLWEWKKTLAKKNIPVGDDNYVICNKTGGMVSVYSPTKWFKEFLAESGGDLKDVRLHSLRHTFASMFLETDPNIYLLKDLMGHTKISTTEIYLKSFRMRKNDLMKNFNEHTELVRKKGETNNENKDNEIHRGGDKNN